MTVMRLNLKHFRTALREDQIVISAGLSPEDDVTNDRTTGGLVEHLAVMFFGVSEPGKLVYGLTSREQQSETKKRQITGHLLNLRIFERFWMPAQCKPAFERCGSTVASNNLNRFRIFTSRARFTL